MKTFYVLLIIIVLTACSTVDDPGSSGKSINVELEMVAIEDLRNKFELAIKEGRYEDIAGLVTTDVMTISAGGPGWDAMRALGQNRGRFPYDSIHMKPTETVILNDTMAYDWGSSSVYYTDENGDPVELRDSFLVLLKKIDGEWKLFREVASSVVQN